MQSISIRDGSRAQREVRLSLVSWSTVAIQKIIDPGTGSLERTIRWRDVSSQIVNASFRFRAVVDGNPDAGLVNHFAPSVRRTAAGPVPQILRAGLRADVFHLAENAIAAGLASEEW